MLYHCCILLLQSQLFGCSFVPSHVICTGKTDRRSFQESSHIALSRRLTSEENKCMASSRCRSVLPIFHSTINTWISAMGLDYCCVIMFMQPINSYARAYFRYAQFKLRRVVMTARIELTKVSSYLQYKPTRALPFTKHVSVWRRPSPTRGRSYFSFLES